MGLHCKEWMAFVCARASVNSRSQNPNGDLGFFSTWMDTKMDGNSETLSEALVPSSPKLELIQEPELKKIKMSSTTDDDNANAGETKTLRCKRRKIAIFFAYCGVGYQGMQKNPGAKTIESDLEEALYLAGGVPEQDRGNSKRYDWARSARTDKGVSAVGQVVSGRFYIDPPGFVDRLNSNLSPQIRIFGYKRVTASFNAKKFCDRRRYVYLLPVFALDPNAHRDRESVLASLGSENELVKCVECSERGRKVEGLMGKRNLESKNAVSDISSDFDNTILTTEFKEERKELSDNANALDLNWEAPKAAECIGEIRSSETKESDDGIIAKPEKRFCYGEEERDRFNKILNLYVGTHNFHNFTTRTKAEDPAARRFIVSFDAETTVFVDGIEFVKCVVVGQSFMLHQIRKMMGVAVAIMRNCTSESLIEKALCKDVNINVPTAPEVGLFLEECLFSSYNKKWKDTHEEVSMKAYEEEAEEFKMKLIHSHIASTEHKGGVVGLWLHSLNHRNYPDLLLKDDETPKKMEE